MLNGKVTEAAHGRRADSIPARGENWLHFRGRPLGQFPSGDDPPLRPGVFRTLSSSHRLGYNPSRATERPAGIVRFRAVVIHENGGVAAIAKEGAAEFF